MNGAELSTAIAGGLFAAVMVGWVLHWIWCLVARAASSERGRIRHLVQQLDAAEAAREAAEAALAAGREALAGRIAVLEAALADQAAAHEAEIGARAREQDRLVAEATREAEAAWEGLALARRRIADLERRLEGRPD